jgi:hypothetical protein
VLLRTKGATAADTAAAVVLVLVVMAGQARAFAAYSPKPLRHPCCRRVGVVVASGVIIEDAAVVVAVVGVRQRWHVGADADVWRLLAGGGWPVW